MNTQINEYLYLLEISLEHIKKTEKEFNEKQDKDDFNYLYFNHYYHIFSFTQIFYSLQERLFWKKYNTINKKKLKAIKPNIIENFFNGKRNISNQLKHCLGNDLIHHIQISVKIDPKLFEEECLHPTTKIIGRIAEGHPIFNSENPIGKITDKHDSFKYIDGFLGIDKNAGELCEELFVELKKFIKNNGLND
jgi:hypothetical protein